MTIQYLKGINNRKELRKAYLKLMKEHHPDVGGDGTIAKIIVNEYEYLLARLPKESTGKTAQSSAEAKKDYRMDKDIRDMLDKIIHMDGINVEVVGCWIWVDGNSYQWKDELKSYGFQWSRKRKKWHWTADTNAGWHRGQNKNFDEIRAKYGSETVETETRARIA